MSISDAHLQKMATYIRSYILRTAEIHGHRNAFFRANARWTHTLNTVKNLKLILDGENAPADVREVTEVAALFHDIDHYTVQHEYHAARGAETATRFLTKEGYDPAFIKRVARCVREHDRDLDDNIPIDTQVAELIASLDLECRMVMDADTLDKIGVSNILQAIMSMSSADKRQVVDAARELTSGWPLQRAKLWKALLTTETGKRLGEERFAFYEMFLKQVEAEIVMHDPYTELLASQEVAQASST